MKLRSSWSIWLLLALGLALRLWIAPSYGYHGFEGDFIEQKQAMHRAISLGVHEVYTANADNSPAMAGGEWAGGYFFVYPPLVVYLRYFPVLAYSKFAPENFEKWNSELNFFSLIRTDFGKRMATSRGFTVAVKLPVLILEILLAAGIFFFVRFTSRNLSEKRGIAVGSGDGWALAAAAAFIFNPGIVLNSAHWGQHDAVWASLLCLSLFLMQRNKIEVAWILYTLACLNKPQASAFIFLVFFLGVTRAPIKRVIIGAILSLATFVLVFSPFIVNGTFLDSLNAIATETLGGEPFISCNANNFWWLASGGRGYGFSDSVPILGLMTARHLGIAIFLVANALIFRRLWKTNETPATLYLAAACVGITFFSFCTELHENHMMVVIPLTCFSLGIYHKLWVPLAVMSVGFFLNMTLFDSEALRFMEALNLPAIPVQELSLLGSVLNLASLVMLYAFLWKDTKSLP